MSAPAFSGRPVEDVEVPDALCGYADGAPVTPVWVNEVGGLTFRVERRGGTEYFKWNPAGSRESLGDERRRLEWLEGRFPAPRVVSSGADAAGEWLATEDLGALSTVAPEWRAQPEVAVRAIAHGLRLLHDSVNAADCPFSWSVEVRVDDAARHAVAVPRELWDAPPIDRLVVCHGDPCAPNTLVSGAGAFAAIVDAGRLGVADRWADLAVASRNLTLNFGPGWDELFFREYGVEPDSARISYYCALWDAA